MQSANSAHNSSNAISTGVTYIDTLISGATAQGMFYVIVDGNKVSSSNVTTLISNGYNVTTKYTDMGTFPQYLITW